MRARRTSFEAELTHALEDIDAKKKEMWQNGGNRLHDAEKELKNCEKDLAQVRKQAENYRVYADVLGLSVPTVLEDFLARRKELEELVGALKAEYDALDAKKFEADSKEQDIVSQISADKTELASLLKRDSNIPAPFIAIRKDLCCDLKVAEKDMPFAGEIMEVKPEEKKWEGALERLLGEFGVSLLVPESLYGKVIDWMEKHFLGRRMVYYRVDEYTPPVSMTDLPETSAARKLHIKRDSPYAGWLASELVHRFDHVCAETTAEFKKARFALSLEGQIKTQGAAIRKMTATRSMTVAITCSVSRTKKRSLSSERNWNASKGSALRRRKSCSRSWRRESPSSESGMPQRTFSWWIISRTLTVSILQTASISRKPSSKASRAIRISSFVSTAK